MVSSPLGKRLRSQFRPSSYRFAVSQCRRVTVLPCDRDTVRRCRHCVGDEDLCELVCGQINWAAATPETGTRKQAHQRTFAAAVQVGRNYVLCVEVARQGSLLSQRRPKETRPSCSPGHAPQQKLMTIQTDTHPDMSKCIKVCENPRLCSRIH